MTVPFMTGEWAQAAGQLLSGWPDEAARADPRKIGSYWAYFDRKRASFDGILAFGVSGVPGQPETRYLALTVDAAGEFTQAQILPRDQVLASAKLALECTYQIWCDMAGGYDISKAMTYHQLPLTVGSAAGLLRCVYFVHEVLVAVLRVGASLPEPAAA